MNNNNEIGQIDALALFGTFLGCLNYTENKKQTSNDELMEELKIHLSGDIDNAINQNELIINQNKLIIKQNEDIIKILEERL